MEQTYYVLRSDEAARMPKNNSTSLAVLKKVVWIIVAIIIVGSFIFQENLFAGLSWTSRIFLIMLATSFMFVGGSEDVPSPFEIQFYNEYVIIYRQKRYYDKKRTRMEYNKFYYKDITKCQYRTHVKRINFVGKVESVWYDYNKDGSVPNQPTYHRVVDDGICFFYTTCSPMVNYVQEIESHSPIRVMISES